MTTIACTKNVMLIFITTYLLNIMVSTTQTLGKLKSQEFVGHIKQHYDNKSSPMFPMVFKILLNAVSKLGCTKTLRQILLMINKVSW